MYLADPDRAISSSPTPFRSELGCAYHWACLNVTDPAHFLSIRPIEGFGQSWLRDERLAASLRFIDEYCGKTARRYGPSVPEKAHILWVAQWLFNNQRVQAALKKAGVDPALAAFVALHHDTLEAMRKKFAPETALDMVAGLWANPGPKDRAIIRAVILYMTDSDPTLKGAARINAQKMKSVYPDASIDPETDELVAILNQELRAADKTHNVSSDAYWRQEFVKAEAANRIPPGASQEELNRFGLSHGELAIACTQADMKRYPLERPGISAESAERYDGPLRYLKDEKLRVAPRLWWSACAAISTAILAVPFRTTLLAAGVMCGKMYGKAEANWMKATLF